MSWTTVETGDPIPPFVQKASTSSGALSFDMTGGRRTLLLFFPSSTDPAINDVLQQLSRYADVLNRKDCLFLGVTLDAADAEHLKTRSGLKSVCFLYDSDRTCHDAFGIAKNAPPGWIELDPMMHVLNTHLHSPGLEQLLFPALLQKATASQRDRPVPVLMLDHVLEPAFCETLIQYHLSHNPQPSPILTSDAAGHPIRTIAPSFKRRLDTPLRDRQIVTDLQNRIIRRVVPEIFRAFRFQATQMDRMLVSSYDATDSGFFDAHRDNTVPSSAHRQFAVSLNLNEGYDGGELIFPEFGQQTFKAPAGGAIVFSCALLHAVQPVTAGRRYACLPFVY
ncbi:2OG-Fe(II) oxygenase [Gluconobacter sp. Dm-62]|uniref:2OG-Fe(II) oxygenase n=1 Tax=Gluconobacter sp. Dm-62 TaxID=2799804 RepID=UPI001B8D4F75|nr:2OG-Fe(II) oxygenase [Gluconobacter sp. Dm-62]MBS1103207.1 2OG-Fe(II) oxygenase [Gluconobacter sp. Dm-62]